jgi:hypothetical protein
LLRSKSKKKDNEKPTKIKNIQCIEIRCKSKNVTAIVDEKSGLDLCGPKTGWPIVENHFDWVLSRPTKMYVENGFVM